MADVVIVRANEQTADDGVRELFRIAGGIERYVSPGERVLIKPNFIAPKKSDTGATTSLEVIEALVKLILEHNATPIIGEGVPFAFNADTTFTRVGARGLAEKYGIELINLDAYPHEIVTFTDSLVLKELPICKMAFDADKIINVPVMKTHSQTTLTLGMKNLKGFIPGEHKLTVHRLGISEGVVDLNTVVKPTFTIIDAIVGMEGNGPTNGIPKRMDLLLGSDDILALEIVSAKVMGFNPYKLRHIYLSKNKNIGQYSSSKINVLGETIEEVQNSFVPPANRISRWISGPLLLGRLLPVLAKCGLDITNLSQNILNRFMAYPTFGENCTACKKCVINCPGQAIRIEDNKTPVLDKQKCSKCYVCDEVCVVGNVKIGDGQ